MPRAGNSSEEKRTNKHKHFFGIVPGTVGLEFVYVLPFSWGPKGTHERDSPRIIPGQSCENLVYVFSCLLVLLALEVRNKVRITPFPGNRRFSQ